MILERLLDFHAAHEEDILPAAFKKQTARWLLELDEEGHFLRLSETAKKKKEQPEIVAPYASRSGSQPPPYLLVDKPNYVLGHVAEADKLTAKKRDAVQAKALDRHADYVALTRACAASVEHPAMDAFVRFLDNDLETARAEATTLPMKPGDLLVPRVGATYLTDVPGVRRFWQLRQDADADENSELTAECLVTGQQAAIARTHPVEILVGPKRDRLRLVSANENSFLSFGLKQSEIAPMSFTAARKYGETLRYLFGHEQHRLSIGGVTWIYWTREETYSDPLFAIKSADPDEVAKLMKSIGTGSPRASLDANDFYALAVSANTSRMVVRSWISTTLTAVQANIARYFAAMRLLDRDGQPHYQKHTALAGSLVREFKDLPDHVTADLLNTALWGTPLSVSLLHRAVQRARAEREHVLTHPRAALIKLILLTNHLYPEDHMPEQMNPAHPHPAYQCGRLLALLDNIQQKAVGARATLVDRYYGAASATPASVFGVLMRNAQNHLGKLRKNEGGLAYYFDQQIAEIAQQLDATQGFPRTLNLQEQGLFALGFYQERNRPRKQTPTVADPDATDD